MVYRSSVWFQKRITALDGCQFNANPEEAARTPLAGIPCPGQSVLLRCPSSVRMNHPCPTSPGMAHFSQERWETSLSASFSRFKGGSARPDGVNRYNPGRLMAGASHFLSVGRVAKQTSSRGRLLFFRAWRGYTKSKTRKSGRSHNA